MKLTEARLRQIIREELTEARRADNRAILQPAPEDGRLELVIKNFNDQTIYAEFLDALDTRDLKYLYATYTPSHLVGLDELGEVTMAGSVTGEWHFVKTADDYIRMMQARQA